MNAISTQEKTPKKSLNVAFFIFDLKTCYTHTVMTKNDVQTTKGVPPTLLVILDGFGLADPAHEGNAITPETAPHMFAYMDQYPTARLKAHGAAVGLFDKQEGNSEAGHFAIGAGRPVEQDVLVISHAIENGTFYKNPAFKQALDFIKKSGGRMHLMGLMTNHDSAHANPDHLYALLELCRRENISHTYLHLFTDGRDSSPHGAVTFLQELREHMSNEQQIASITGRLYAMDRNKAWDRIEQAYQVLTSGKGTCTAHSAEEAISQAYNRGETDEYICPTVIVDEHKDPIATIQEGDAVIFFNARSDRARELTKAFVQDDFEKRNPGAFTRKKVFDDIRFVAMSEFGPDLPDVLTAFPSPDLTDCLAAVIGESRKQLYISETEKYAHVTYFMNGGYPQPINGEERQLVHSTGADSYAQTPAMQSAGITQNILDALEQDYTFVCVNYPNADMVGHSGDIAAAKKAVQIIDQSVAALVDATLAHDGAVIVTGDHGNAEEMIDLNTGEMKTEHTTNPVPCIIIRNDLKGKQTKRKKGTLADVAPTLLQLMRIKKPEAMTGRSLI